MKERPILFSGEMVRAILEGKKTQTRRVVNGGAIHADWPLTELQEYSGGVANFHVQNDVDSYTTKRIACPYGQQGDRLWVRETWKPTLDNKSVAYYRASFDPMIAGVVIWKPSIFMPRWASRITLEITRIGIERVQCITEDDARAEGVDSIDTFHFLWNEINHKRGYGWRTNLWVWVIEFKKVSAA